MTKTTKGNDEMGESNELTVLEGGAGVPGGKTAEAIETPEDAAAWKLREEIQQIVKRMGEDLFELCKALYEVYSHMMYLKWGYKTWKEYVESEIQFKLRKAQYYVAIWNWFGELPDDVREKVASLGWSKVSLLVGVVDEDNVDEWVEKASEMTCEQLAQEAKRYLKPPEDESDGAGGESVSRMTFTLFEEQKEVIEDALGHAKEMAESEKKGHLLALICQEFLSTNSDQTPEPSVLLDRMERFTGIKLIGVNMDSKEIVYGEKTLDEVIAAGKDD